MTSKNQAEMQSAAGQISPAIYPGGKVAAFDGLRGVAITLVVTHHLLPNNTLEGGVEIFLVLSGYLITTILLREHTKTGSIRYGRFLYRRVLRLYPALVVVTACVGVGLCVSGLAGFAVRQAGYALTYTFDFAISLAHVAIGPLGHTWSLSLEQQFYLTWPLLVVLLTRLSPVTRLVAMTLVAIAGVLGQIVLFVEYDNFGPGARMGALLVGCLLAFGLDHRRVRLSPAWLLVAAVAFVAMTVMVDATKTLGHIWVHPTASLLAAVAVWVLATAHDRHVGFLTNRAVIHLGLMSYGVFLWHYPLIYFLGRADISGWSAAAVVVPVSLVLAELSRRFVENPFLRLKDRTPGFARRRSVADESGQPATSGHTADDAPIAPLEHGSGDTAVTVERNR